MQPKISTMSIKKISRKTSIFCFVLFIRDYITIFNMPETINNDNDDENTGSGDSEYENCNTTTSVDSDKSSNSHNEAESSPPAAATGSFQAFYEDQSKCEPRNHLPLLMLVAEEVVPDFKFDAYPYNAVPKISVLKPGKKHIVMELNRRSKKNRKFKNEKNDVLKKMLFQDYPLINEQDIAFIKAKEKECCETLAEELEEQVPDPAPEACALKNDRLRFVHLFFDTDIEIAFKWSQDTMTRQELDARNSSDKPPDFFDLAVKKFNDATWIPATLEFPDLHDDFKETFNLPLRSYYMTRQKAKDLMTRMRAKLIKIKDNYELSGNGSLQRDNLTSADTMPFDVENTVEGNEKTNFLGHEATDLLYWWEVLDRVQVLDYMLGLMPSLEGDATQSIEDPAPLSKRARREEEHATLSLSLQNVSNELASSRNVAVTKEVINIKRRLNELKEKFEEHKRSPDNEWRCKFVKLEINDLQIELTNIERMRQMS
jgi:hypothetical protein